MSLGQHCSKSYAQIINEYGNVLTFTEYYGICNSVNPVWKRILREDGPLGTVGPNPLQTILQIDNVFRVVYDYLIDFRYATEDKKDKWENILCTCIDMKTFCKYFRNIYLITNMSKIRSFQYRLLNHAIVTNIHLFHFKIRSDDLCSFCDCCRETILHLFFYCETVQKFWTDVLKFCDEILDWEVEPEFNYVNLIFNTLKEQPRHVVNFIFLLGKVYIYRNRCLGKSLSMCEFEHYVYETKAVEKYITMKNQTMDKYMYKWYNVKPSNQGEDFVNDCLDEHANGIINV